MTEQQNQTTQTQPPPTLVDDLPSDLRTALKNQQIQINGCHSSIGEVRSLAGNVQRRELDIVERLEKLESRVGKIADYLNQQKAKSKEAAK